MIHIVAGPTAAGKTEYALDLAEQLDAEIISADSVQVFRYLDIGSAKIKESEMRGVPHHLIDFLDPDENFSVGEFANLAKALIAEIQSRKKAVIVCGGTGLYLHSLIYDMDFYDAVLDKGLRERLSGLGLDALLRYAGEIGLETKNIEINNPRRLIRAIEVFAATGKQPEKIKNLKRSDYNISLHLIDPDRKVLYERINKRAEIMLESGLIEETEAIISKFPGELQGMNSVGYRQVCSFLKGQMSRDELTAQIQQATRNYAKRQVTWFKRYDTMVTNRISKIGE